MRRAHTSLLQGHVTRRITSVRTEHPSVGLLQSVSLNFTCWIHFQVSSEAVCARARHVRARAACEAVITGLSYCCRHESGTRRRVLGSPAVAGVDPRRSISDLGEQHLKGSFGPPEFSDDHPVAGLQVLTWLWGRRSSCSQRNQNLFHVSPQHVSFVI